MAALASTHPNLLQFTPKLKPWNRKLQPKRITTKLSIQAVSASPQASFTDQFVLQLADSLEDSVPSSLPLQNLRDNSSETLLSTQWPSRKDEPFRFTDTSFIKNSDIKPISHPPKSLTVSDISRDAQVKSFYFSDGFLLDSSFDSSNLPDGVYVGSLLKLPSVGILKRVSELLGDLEWGDLFWSVNGLGAPDLMVVYVPEGCKVEQPIYLKYIAVEGGDEGSKTMPLSNPRVFVLVEKGGEVGIVEEFAGKEESECYWTNSVLEVMIGEGGKVSHSYVQNQSLNAAHIKWTSVRQESTSAYELVEVSTGGKLSRHNVHVQQLGPDTETKLTTFHLCVGDQTQDLHSRIVLDHPRGYCQQLHKCIVAHSSGQAVFDGNVKVNRYAQQTDAGQLTRSLLLEPRATVNLKPNLQIIADDVKCSHGAAISDLEDSQLFYFQARGIDLETARKALVFSFGAEVIDRLPHSFLQKQVKENVKELLGSISKDS
ncbi:ATP-binding cassette I7, non-intrinsic ABC protein 6 [Hibiscus trionum]|uniref:ATP-binding cassette I7, non-intrinsic ABC protein 6 n=1 Tax=Hibiscus trionum TaxID=183268 RepID=A0A9W7GQL8_HIBTR|nr:ATP-binding cassette I7, non-intrinsic ABC protein 6 [Hibiscus trionum]